MCMSVYCVRVPLLRAEMTRFAGCWRLVWLIPVTVEDGHDRCSSGIRLVLFFTPLKRVGAKVHVSVCSLVIVIRFDVTALR
jgi:hypothetical protein